jgi:type I restriction enzyme M protein
MYIERSGLHGTFTIEYLDQRSLSRMPNDPLVHDGLFELTKDFYKADDLFAAQDKLEISEETFRRIVKQLERFDLSKTGDDIKGLAFERFLGTTFRGELGQFFTPRPVVDFMVDLLNPQEGQLICDPAAGSGGFLIRAFEHVRGAIVADVQRQKDAERARIEALALPEEEEERQIEAAFARLNRELLPSDEDNKPVDTRVGRLAWRCVYGTDAEPRAARTAKMNMIMHGDGHGGIHYHDGLLDINGIFNGRFDLVLTNPPFGANVGADQRVNASEETRVPTDPEYLYRCRARYGEVWEESHQRLRQADTEKTPILDLFQIGKGKSNRPTELIFVERCLNLLAPGGRMGIVLPDGNLNNPSLAWLRRWAEGRAKLLAVASLPEETFRSSNATVKASLVFLRRFTEAEAASWEAAWAGAHGELDAHFDEQRNSLHDDYSARIVSGDSAEVARRVAELYALEVERYLPAWERGEPPAYPRGIGPTLQARPKWGGEADEKHKKQAVALKRQCQTALKDVREVSDALFSELKAKYRAVDEAHNAALWARVREVFDYPVFVAAPKTVGITSTGETGEGVANELPQVLEAFRQFEAWLAKGANEDETPDPLPSFPMPGSNIRYWKEIERWTATQTNDCIRKSAYPMLPLREVLSERCESVNINGNLEDWQAITIKFSGEVIPRERESSFKGAMFAAYPGDLVFSKIDARNGAVGLIPASIPKVVVTSEYPVLIPDTTKLRPAYLNYLLRAEHFKVALRHKASGTSGRKRVTRDDFLSLEVPMPPPSKQDELLRNLLYAEKMRRVAQKLHDRYHRHFERQLFTTNL